MTARSLQIVSGLYGLTGVALGAFGAHWLKPRLLESGMSHAWDTAVFYQLFHAASLFALSTQANPPAGVTSLLKWTGTFWSLGVLFFSGSLYLIALDGPRWLGPITPLGGLAFLLGWGVVIVAGLKRSRA